jgi:hypothetical protein
MRAIELSGRGTVKLAFGSEQGLSGQAYLAFCRANPGLRVELAGEGPVKGLLLKLAAIWRGLR